MINGQKTAYFFLVLLILVLAVSPAFALGKDNRSLLLIGIMSLSPVLIIAFNKYHKTDLWIVVFMFSIILIPLLNQPRSMRWSTVLYSCMFCLCFMAYTRLLARSKLNPIKYLKILKVLILAYAITLLIQQFCVLFGLPIFNVSNYNETTPWKLNGLAAEPSHSARIVTLLMYSYIVIKEILLNGNYNLKKEFKNDIWIWIGFIWTMFTMGSGSAFLFLPLILFKTLKRKNIFPLILITISVFILINFLGIDQFNRTFNVVNAVITFDVDTIIAADHSASLRIIPFFVLITMLSLSTLDGWFGHGIDFVSSFMSDIIPGVTEGFSGGGLLQLFMEYGFVCFIIFTFGSILHLIKQNDRLSIVFWLLLILLNGMNSQILWLCSVLLFTNKYFLKFKKNYFNENP